MTLTATDLFCGAGGSSLGAETAGLELKMAANHWQTAIDVHQAHFPNAGHDVADISQADPRRYPRTDVLMASPECTNHSQARGVSRRKQDPTLWDAPDPAAERSRATMWDVPRFAEQLLHDVIIVENVVEATKWVGWRAWHVAMEDLGYEHRVISTNSMHHGVPQSRDRIYVVFWRKGIEIDLDLETMAWCVRCDGPRRCVQAWKAGRAVGRYRQQWVWRCTTCASEASPPVHGADTIIDWELDCPRIGDRARPLVAKTRARIAAGIQRYWPDAFTTAGAGNTYETTPGNRSRPVTDPLPVQQASATHAVAVPFVTTDQPNNVPREVDEPLATVTTSVSRHGLVEPPAFLINTAHGGRLHDPADPHPTVCASDDRLSLILQTANGGQNGGGARPAAEPTYTATTTSSQALVVPLRSNGHAQPVDGPAPTVTAGGNHHGLLMRNQSGGAEMITPTDEPVRTLTTKGHQSLLMPYYGRTELQPVERPVPTVPTRERFALVDMDALVDDCGFRMLEPHEIAAAMAFPAGYIPSDLPKKHRVKLAGNAVTPPVMAWIVGRVVEALGG